jgi:uncharacterized protein YeaO (DUF488 family)
MRLRIILILEVLLLLTACGPSVQAGPDTVVASFYPLAFAAKEIAPSAELRTWFGHDPARWDEFRRRYRAEIAHHPEILKDLRRRAREGPLTLVYSARDEVHNDALVLRDVILGRKDHSK